MKTLVIWRYWLCCPWSQSSPGVICWPTHPGREVRAEVALSEANGSSFWRWSWKFLRSSAPFYQGKAHSTYEMSPVLSGGAQAPSEAHPWSGHVRTTGQELCCFHSHLDSCLEMMLATRIRFPLSKPCHSFPHLQTSSYTSKVPTSA